MNFQKTGLRFVLFIIGVSLSISVNAITRIAILEFELKDITALPNTPEEIVRTASFKPLLESELEISGEYEIIQISAGDYARANAGVGYLYTYHDLAADLGQQYGADWVIVGQHSKPSFLFSYLLVNIVDVKKRSLKTSYTIELKGTHRTVTEHGIRAIARVINGALVASP